MREIENCGFWNKAAVYKTKVVNRFLKCFLNKWNFFKYDFEIELCWLAHFTWKLIWVILKPGFANGHILREN